MKKITFIIFVASISLFAQKRRTLLVTTNPAENQYTLQEALSTVQKINKKGEYPVGGITILIEEGEYPVQKGFRLFKDHSGTKEAPLVIRGKKGHKVVFFGGEYLKANWFSSLDDTIILNRMVSKDAARKILTIDLKKHGIESFGTISKHGWNLEHHTRVAPTGLSIGGERMELARWPNKNENSSYLEEKARIGGVLKGMVSYTKIIEKGASKPRISDWHKDKNFMNNGGTFEVGFDRMKYWMDVDNVWIDGVLGTTWEWTYTNIKSVNLDKKTITLQSGELNGLGGGLPRLSHFYFENILEELDREGEYYIDRKEGVLYMIPPKNFHEKSIFVSSLADDAFSISNAAWIQLENITIDSGRKNGIVVQRSHHITIHNCEVRNVAMGGVLLSGSFNEIHHSKIHHVGAYGVALKGGDKESLRPGNNLVENCEIYSSGWDQKSQMPGVFLDKGVGNHVRNNEIYDMPHFAIRMNYNNDCTVVNNKIHDLPTYHMFDGGAVYVYTSPLNPANRGNVLRNNYLYNVPTNGIYCDNYAMGVFMEQNYFKNVSNLDSEWGFGAIMLNTGGQNYMNDNVFVDCRIPILYGVGGYYNSYKGKPKVQNAWNNAVQKYGAGKIEGTPYAKYTTFKDFIALSAKKDYEAFKYPLSYANRNLFYNPIVPLEASANNPKGITNKRKKIVAKDNYFSIENPGIKKNSLEITAKNSKKIPIEKFNPGDFNTIGVQN